MKKVLCAMSGGVDSTVSAYLLKKQGYNVTGIFFTMFKGQEKQAQEVKELCKYLEIPFINIDVSKKFKKDIIDYFVNEYESGRTPNPCIMCNLKIKFDELLHIAKKMNIKYIATGHYVRLQRKITNNKLQTILLEAKDKKKDQSYFLYRLGQNVLKCSIFPLGDYNKEEVKKIALKARLPIAQKKESQDICFIKDNDIRKFLNKYAKNLKKSGKVVDKNGVELGKHNGLIYYTIGQRSGLSQINIQNSSVLNMKSKIEKKQSMLPPLYVIKLDVAKNEMILGTEKDLYLKTALIDQINWINSNNIGRNLYFQAKIRSSLKKVKCKIDCGHNRKNYQITKLPNCYKNNNITIKQCNNAIITFNKPQRAITPGQSMVFYNQQQVIGGGIII